MPFKKVEKRIQKGSDQSIGRIPNLTEVFKSQFDICLSHFIDFLKRRKEKFETSGIRSFFSFSNEVQKFASKFPNLWSIGSYQLFRLYVGYRTILSFVSSPYSSTIALYGEKLRKKEILTIFFCSFQFENCEEMLVFRNN